MRTASRSFGVIVISTTLALGACFTYLPSEPETVPVGEGVRVYLTPEKMRELREADDQGLPESGAPMVTGTLIRQDNGDIAVRIPIITRQVGFLQTQIGRQVTISSTDIIQLERRQLNRGRTTLAAVALGGVVAYVAHLILEDARLPVRHDYPPRVDGAVWIPIVSLRSGNPSR